MFRMTFKKKEILSYLTWVIYCVLIQFLPISQWFIMGLTMLPAFIVTFFIIKDLKNEIRKTRTY